MMRRYDITDPRERAGQSTNGTCQSQAFSSCTAWSIPLLRHGSKNLKKEKYAKKYAIMSTTFEFYDLQ